MIDEIWRGQTPQFTHDCDECTFLGRFRVPRVAYMGGEVLEAEDYDLYVHLSPHPERRQHSPLIARFSSRGQDYLSHEYEAAKHTRRLPTVVARERARAFVEGQ